MRKNLSYFFNLFSLGAVTSSLLIMVVLFTQIALYGRTYINEDSSFILHIEMTLAYLSFIWWGFIIIKKKDLILD